MHVAVVDMAVGEPADDRHRQLAGNASHRDGERRSRDAVARTLHDPDLDVVLLDLFLGDESGIDVLEEIRRERPEVEVIVMTGHASIESAVGCMRRGALQS